MGKCQVICPQSDISRCMSKAYALTGKPTTFFGVTQASLYSVLTGGSAMYSLSHRSLWPSFAGDISACAFRALKTSLYSVLFGTVFRRPHQTTGRSSFRFGFKQPRQLRDIAGDAPRLIHRQHIGDLRVSLCLARVDIGQGLTVGVFDFITARCLLDSPWRGEAARHG